MSTVDLAVPTVHCNACKLNIEEALAELAGVNVATVDLAAKSVRVEYDPTTVDNETMAAAIEAAGYPVS